MGLEFRLITHLKQCCFIILALWSVLVKADSEGNWLAGFAVGYARHTGDMTINATYNIPNGITEIPTNGNGESWTKGAFFGYRYLCNGFIWEGEFNVDYYPQESDFFFDFNDCFNDSRCFTGSLYQGTRQYKHSTAFGITGRWGYTISPYFMPYIVMGLETNKETLTITIEGNSAFFSQPLVMSATQRQWRGIAGFGAEIPLCFWCLDHLSLRFEYRYCGLDKVLNPRGRLSGTIPSPVDFPIESDFSMAMRPKFNVVKVGLLWNF